MSRFVRCWVREVITGSGQARLLQLLCGIAMAVSLARCSGGKGTPTGPTPNPPSAPLTLTAPAVLAPADDFDLGGAQPELVVSNATANRSGTRQYEFQVADTASFTAEGSAAGIVATKTVAEGGDGRTSAVIDEPLRPGTQYHWRARASQDGTISPWSNTSRFHTTPPRPSITPPSVAEPPDNAQLDTVRPRLVVNNAAADGSPHVYEFQLADNPGFSFTSGFAALTISATVPEGPAGVTAWQPDGDLRAGTRYYWRVRTFEGTVAGDWSPVLRFVTAPPRPNTPPVIRSLTANSGRVEVAELLHLSAVVEDAETPLDSLVYQWTATAGAFVGVGAVTDWQAPALLDAPATYTLTLTVIERYTTPVPDGGETQLENRTSASVSVDVNDSPTELTVLALTFLADFSNSTVSPQSCVRNFSDNCRGKQSELTDITNNRATYEILSASYHVDSIRLNALRQFADIRASCEFSSRVKASGKIELARGDCLLTGVYENRQWKLCDSSFRGSTLTGLPFVF